MKLSDLVELAKQQCVAMDVEDDGDATPGPDAMLEDGDDFGTESLDADSEGGDDFGTESLDSTEGDDFGTESLDDIDADQDMLQVGDADPENFDPDDELDEEEEDDQDIDDEDGDLLHPKGNDGTLPPIKDTDGCGNPALLSSADLTKPISLRTAIAGRGPKPVIDRANNSIRNVAVMQAGEAKGHSFSIDKKMLGQAEAGMKNGVAMRFKHPQKVRSDGSSEIVDPLGSHVGKVTNVRLSDAGDEVRGDIEFGPHARHVPGYGDVATYLMDLAEHDPEAFGLSTVYQPAQYERGSDGMPLGRIDRVAACDLTGDPASTRQGLL